jgi:hypothetical protein
VQFGIVFPGYSKIYLILCFIYHIQLHSQLVIYTTGYNSIIYSITLHISKELYIMYHLVFVIYIYRVSQGERAKHREGVPYVKLYRKTQNTYIQNWTVYEILAVEVWNFDSCYTLTDYQIHIETGRSMWFL